MLGASHLSLTHSRNTYGPHLMDSRANCPYAETASGSSPDSPPETGVWRRWRYPTGHHRASGACQ